MHIRNLVYCVQDRWVMETLVQCSMHWKACEAQCVCQRAEREVLCKKTTNDNFYVWMFWWFWLQVDLIEMTNSVDESLSKIEPPPQRPGMVARLLELKKRRAQMANGKHCVLLIVALTEHLIPQSVTISGIIWNRIEACLCVEPSK